MPRIIPLSEILQMEPDEPIVCTQGTLVEVYKQKRNKPDDDKKWSLQDCVIESNGTRIKLWLKDREEIHASWKGRQIEIAAYHGERGFTGVYAYDDDYRDKDRPERKIRVTGTASISIIENTSGSRREEPRRETRAERPPERTQERERPREERPADRTERPPSDEPPPQRPPAQRPAPGSQQDVLDAIGSANQVANLQILAFATVEDYVAPLYKRKTGKDMDEILKSNSAMNIVIQLEKTGVHFKMPATRYPLVAPAKTEPQRQEPAIQTNAKGERVHPVTGEPIDENGNFRF